MGRVVSLARAPRQPLWPLQAGGAGPPRHSPPLPGSGGAAGPPPPACHVPALGGVDRQAEQSLFLLWCGCFCFAFPPYRVADTS